MVFVTDVVEQQKRAEYIPIEENLRQVSSSMRFRYLEILAIGRTEKILVGLHRGLCFVNSPDCG
jgi:hypothetical protein